MADYYWDESASESDIEKDQVVEWCIECQSQEPMTTDDDLCSCCFHQVEVEHEGLPSVFNDYWLPSLEESQLIGCFKSCDNPPPVYQSLNNREDVTMKYLKRTVEKEPEIVYVELNNWTELFE